MTNIYQTIKIESKKVPTEDGSGKVLVHYTKTGGIWYQVMFASKAMCKPTSTGFWDVTVNKYLVKPNGSMPIIYIVQSYSCFPAELPKKNQYYW